MLTRMLMGGVIAGLSLAALAAGGAPAQAAAPRKEPPKCSAITFRPLPAGMTDGDQDAGMYRSRFGRIVVKGTVKSGEAQTYFVVVNGQKLAPLQGALPKTVESCLKSKHVAVPVQSQQGSCGGTRLRLVIDSTGKQKLLMFFGLKGDTWQLCEAGIAPGQ